MDKVEQICSFDIETAGLAPRRNSAEENWAIGVNCAATASTYEGRADVRLWWSGQGVLPGIDQAGAPPAMDPSRLKELIYFLGQRLLDGFVPFTWNGSGFEFRVIAAEAPFLARACKFLALNHVDGFFQLYTLSGNFIGVDAALRGMGFPGKEVAGMSGADAPEEWKKDHKKVLRYVTEDVWQPLQLFHRCKELGYLNWAAKGNAGVNYNVKNMRRTKGWGNTVIKGWYTVHDLMTNFPEPTPYPATLPSRTDMLKWLSKIEPINEDDIGILPEALVRAAIRSR